MKRVALLFLAFAVVLSAQFVGGSRHRIIGVSSNGSKSKLLVPTMATVNGTRYTNPSGGSTTLSSGTMVTPMPTAGSFQKLYVYLSGDPDSGASANGYSFTLNKGGSATSITVNVLSSTSGFHSAYTSSPVHFNTGDLITLVQAPVGTPANLVNFSAEIEFQGDTTGETILLGGINGNALSATTNEFVPVYGEKNVFTLESEYWSVFPVAGTITKFSTNLTTVPGGTGTRTFQLRQNAGNIGTTITYTAAQSGVQSQAQSISVSAGDRIDIESNTTNSPATSTAGWGLVFVPTVTGQFIIPVTATSTLSASATRFMPIAGISITPGATETSVNLQNAVTADFSLNGFVAFDDANPGGGVKQYTLSLERNAGAAGTTYSTVMNSAGPTASATTNYPIVANYDLLGIKIVPSGTPTVARTAISFIGTIP